MTQYIIYCNNIELARVNADQLKYTDENASIGENTYRIKAVYGDKISQASDKVKVQILASYDFPFTETFEEGITPGYWTTEGGNWAIYDNAGIANSRNIVYISAPNNFDYNSVLQTRPINAENVKNVYLSFAYRTSMRPIQYEANKMYLEYTLATNPTNWETIKEYNLENPQDFNIETLDLTKQLAGKAFSLRFRVSGKGRDIVQFFLDDVIISDKMPDGPVPLGVKVKETEKKTVDVSWQDPKVFYEWAYAPKEHISIYGIGNEGKTFIAVNKMNPEDLAAYKGMELKSITATANQYYYSAERTPTKLKLAVFVGDKRVVNQDVEQVDGSWNVFKLDKPVVIEGNEVIRYGLEVVEHHEKERPIGFYALPVAPNKGDLYSEDGGKTWNSLFDIDQKVTWNIVGNVATKEVTEEYTNDIFGYELYRNGVRVNNGLIYSQSYTDTIPEKWSCYTVRAYSMVSGTSAMSEEVCSGESSIKDIRSSFSIYPNPVSDFIYIEGEFTKATLYDISGLTVAGTSDNTLPVRHLQNGTYILLIETNDGRISQKVIVSH